MIYLISLRKYVFILFKTLIFTAFLLLIYVIAEILFLKSAGASSLYGEAFKNYGILLLKAMPFTVLFASCLYFSSIGTEKAFIFTMVPLIAVLNTVIIFLCFLVNADFDKLRSQADYYYYPELKTGDITAIGDYKIALTGGKRGILFYKNAYLFNGYGTDRNNITVNTYQAAGNNSIYASYNNFTIPYKTPVLKLQETGITYFVLDRFLQYVKDLQNVYYSAFSGGNIIYAVLAFLFMNLGFFAFACGISGFFSEKQTLALTWSAVTLLAFGLFVIYPQYLNLMSIIKFGFKNNDVRLMVSSVSAGLLGWIIGYVLTHLRIMSRKKRAGFQ